MKNLILGSAGQIGTGLTNYLRNNGEQVITFDITDSIHQDLRKQDALDYVINKCDFIYFLAFDVGGSRYLKKYQHTFNFIDNNTKILCNTFNSIKVSGKPFIFASSQMSNMEHSPYGTLKSIGEIYTQILGGLVVKFWNVYGNETDLEKSHVITDFILSAKANKKICMLTDGEEERQMLYVDDCCKCLTALAKNYQNIPRDIPLHITSFEWIKIIEIANLIAGYFPGTNIYPAASKDTVQLNKRNEPSRDIFKYWAPETSIAQGIKHVIDKT